MLKKLMAIGLGLGLALSPAVVTAQETKTQVEFRENVNVSEWSRGTYEYIKGSTGKWRGEDEWNLTVNKDGSRTMRMFSLVQETGIMRDFWSRVDENFRPLEALTITYKNGVRTGTGMFVFTGEKGVGVVQSPNGLLTQEVTMPGFFSMIPHSMACDGWYFGQYDRKKGGVQTLQIFNPHGGGDTNGSILARIQTATIKLIGPERITVPAGTFDTEKWALTNGDDLYTVWVYGDDHVMVKYQDHPRDLIYNLTSFKTSRK